MKNICVHNQSMHHGFAFRARLANLLEMPEKEYAGLIFEIESDPLFIKLRYAHDKKEKAIHFRRLQQTDLSRRFFELKEDRTQYSDNTAAEVEKLLSDKEKIVQLIRKIGEEKFKKYFIYNEDELSLDEISDSLDLSIEKVKEILWLINTIDVYSEFFSPSKTTFENNIFYNKIAVIVKASHRFTIQFTSVHWARGLYEIDYEKIKYMVKAGRISKGENKRLKKLLEKMEFINVRKSLMSNVISGIIDKQSKYLKTGSETGLVPFLQIELAKDMNVHPSIISRAISGRSIETPRGEERPLKSFFISAKPTQKKAVLQYIADILNNEKIQIQKHKITKPISDKQIAALLRDKYSIPISQRTAAKYRNELNIPGAFHRKA